ncbi:hypothetical protein [uncultured Comamonas sp.]|uniref:hypothetical protein n=1 Tax=uncultured Comamonas sp. TaxID=114710 RepID=UPI0025D26B01|nr:hypothetical protein [uncultured Comamonas sp.]
MPISGTPAPFDLKLHAWLSKIEAAQPCHGQQEAHDLIMSLWAQTHREGGAPDGLVQSLLNRKLCSEDGWQWLDSDVAFTDMDASVSVRVHLHRDGSVVIQSIDEDAPQILGVLPAAPQDQLVSIKVG